MSEWQIDSWQTKPIKQQPTYKESLDKVTTQLANNPELVIPAEIRKLKSELAKVVEGKAFLLQGGDCAESFVEFNRKNLRNYFKILLQMTGVLMHGAAVPVVKVGRIAGQFAKPRSANTETINGVELPSYRGDMVNAIDFNQEAREPDPQRLLQCYNQSSATLNYLRSLALGGFSSIEDINQWNIDFIKQTPQGEKFQDIMDAIQDAVKFIKACGLPVSENKALTTASFYTSHEGLILPYEQGLLRQDEFGDWYCCSAHMLWIGDRTRDLDGAHIEFMRGIKNPIGCKVGNSMTVDEIAKIAEVLNPTNEAGRLTLISRMGSDKIAEQLPPLVRKVKETGINVVWSSDPMHGNTIKTSNGYKSRKFDSILSEIEQFFEIHKAEGTQAGGVHFEMTGQQVTECLGGSYDNISELDLEKSYQTACDPRLNATQALELAFLLSQKLKTLQK